ncbi:hypothetical protein F4801DRAFT_296271 [Xylaria longipes]|nr:hypothetical protein F4801DRAFT_296271 [Xylaria longipes]
MRRFRSLLFRTFLRCWCARFRVGVHVVDDCRETLQFGHGRDYLIFGGVANSSDVWRGNRQRLTPLKARVAGWVGT